MFWQPEVDILTLLTAITLFTAAQILFLNCPRRGDFLTDHDITFNMYVYIHAIFHHSTA